MHKIRDRCGERFWPPDFMLQRSENSAHAVLKHRNTMHLWKFIICTSAILGHAIPGNTGYGKSHTCNPVNGKAGDKVKIWHRLALSNYCQNTMEKVEFKTTFMRRGEERHSVKLYVNAWV